MKKLNDVIFKQRALDIHGDKYDYSQVQYVNMTTKVTIICPDHGQFQQSPSNHLLKRAGCSTCSHSTLISNNKSRAKSTRWFITQATTIHGSLYDYTRVEYKNQQERVEIICSIHGSFFQRPSDHIYGKNGCPQCGTEKSRKSRVKNTQIFIEESRRIHENTYNYEKVQYVNESTPVTISCDKHGEFNQRPQYHIKGSGCPKCVGSRGEKMVIRILEDCHIPYYFQHSFRECLSSTGTKLYFDFYLPNQNILIEFDGELHHRYVPHFHKTKKKFAELKERDDLKNLFAEKHKISLIRLTELNYGAIKNTLTPLL